MAKTPRAGELTTTNYGWTKPTVGASDDAWGGMVNADLDGIDSTVKAVSTVANAAYPASNPAGYITAAAIPAPYVLPTASTTVLGGVKVDGTTVAISGGGVISAAGAVAVSAIAPSSPGVGSLWFDSNGGQMYVWYNDGTSSQWVPVVNQGSAPTSPLLVKPPSAASWTKRFFTGTATLTDSSIGPVLVETTLSTDQLELATIAVPSTPYVIDAVLNFSGCSLAGQYTSIAIGWTDGAKIQSMQFSVSAAASTPLRTNVLNWTSSTVQSGPVVAFDMYWSPLAIYVRLADNGTNVTFSTSNDGVNFVQLYTVAKASGFLGSSGYANVGWGLEAFAGAGTSNPPSVYACLKSWWVH